jgi:uncharacterized protein DUF3105
VAKKSRTPAPPRKVQVPKQRNVQAPKQRTTKRQPPAPSDRNTRYLLGGFAAAGLIAVAVVVGFLATRGGGANDKGVAQVLRAAGYTYKVYPATSQQHVALTAKPKYNSFPPSNGAHYGIPAVFGNYSSPVEQIRAVHNLEHGAMLIEYGPGVSRATIDKINAFYGESPNGMLVFPYPPLKNRIALVAWTADLGKLQSRSATGGYHGEGRVAIGTRFDQKAFETFRDRFRAKGPERFPLDALQPGG